MMTNELPEGMTAERLRELAEDMAHHDGWSLESEMVSAWADAIDPPKPPPVVTDEMVRTYAVARWGGRMDMDPNDSDRKDLEAVERLGWLRDPGREMVEATELEALREFTALLFEGEEPELTDDDLAYGIYFSDHLTDAQFYAPLSSAQRDAIRKAKEAQR